MLRLFNFDHLWGRYRCIIMNEIIGFQGNQLIILNRFVGFWWNSAVRRRFFKVWLFLLLITSFTILITDIIIWSRGSWRRCKTYFYHLIVYIFIWFHSNYHWWRIHLSFTPYKIINFPRADLHFLFYPYHSTGLLLLASWFGHYRSILRFNHTLYSLIFIFPVHVCLYLNIIAFHCLSDFIEIWNFLYFNRFFFEII